MADPATPNLAAIDRVLVYRWLAGFFAREVEVETLASYRSAEGDSFLKGLEAEPVLLTLVSALRGIIEDEDALQSRVLDLKTAFARLFLGVGGHRSAPPYHSAYASEKGILFQEQMMEMNGILQELDMSIADNVKEPPDHLAIQLSVMAELAERAMQNEVQASPPEQAQACQRQIAYMDKHILSWLPAFCIDCAAYDPSQVYGLAANAALAFLKQDRKHLMQAQEPKI